MGITAKDLLDGLKMQMDNDFMRIDNDFHDAYANSSGTERAGRYAEILAFAMRRVSHYITLINSTELEDNENKNVVNNVPWKTRY